MANDRHDHETPRTDVTAVQCDGDGDFHTMFVPSSVILTVAVCARCNGGHAVWHGYDDEGRIPSSSWDDLIDTI